MQATSKAWERSTSRTLRWPSSPGGVAVGSEAIRQVFKDFVASGVNLTLGDQQPSLRVGDLALGWTRLLDGRVTAEVPRRQPDGTWRWVIDQWNVLDG